MKQISLILSFLVLGATLFLTACDDGGSTGTNEKEQQIEKLVGTWNAQSVTYEGTPNTNYSNFSIQISKASSEAMNYTITGRPTGISPWNSQGTFRFGSPVATVLVREDDVTVKYAVDGTSLQLTLEDYTGEEYQSGRVGSVAGTWVFNLIKQ